MNRKQRRASRKTDPKQKSPPSAAGVERLFFEAQGHHQTGRLREAKELYKRILETHPDHPPTLQFLGVIAFQTGNLNPAKALITKALGIDPNLEGAYGNLGIVLKEMGELKAAKECYSRAIAQNPDHSEAHNNLGIVQKDLGDLDSAEKSFRRALAVNPNFVEAHVNLGNVLSDRGKFEGAKESYSRAISLKPDYAMAYSNLGNTLNELGDFGAAKETCEHAIALAPDSAEAHNNLGIALLQLGELDAAKKSCQKAIAIFPGYANAHSNLGAILNELGELGKARESCNHAISLEPRLADAYNNLGRIFLSLCDPSAARKNFEHALTIRPDHPSTKFNIGYVSLLMGDFEDGWKGYEARREMREFIPHIRSFPQPYWDGSPLDGRTILLHAEQGLGDSIQYLRYIKKIAGHGGKIVVELQAALAPLAAQIKEIDTFVPRGEPFPDFDVHAGLLSLPFLFETRLDTIPTEVPYLGPGNAPCVFDFSQSGKFKVGFVWGGNPEHKNDRNRSLDASYFGPLLKTPNTAFFSLQVGDREAELSETDFSSNVTNLGSTLRDFGATASAIGQLDLVICVDTSVAHLAGAMAKPVWLLLPIAPDFRWLLDRDDSPWYPTMRLFRQPKTGDWNSVFSDVSRELKRLVAKSSKK